MNKILFLLIFVSINCYSFIISEEKFFSDSIITTAKNDLNKFLITIPVNKGQDDKIKRLIDTNNYDYLIILLNPSFKEDEIKELLNIKRPFQLIEILDILSYNLKYNMDYSSWYINNLYILSKSDNEHYMNLFISLMLKSDGIYSEIIVNKMIKLISGNQEYFIKNVVNNNNKNDICRYLKIGNYKKLIKKLINKYKGMKNINIDFEDFIKCMMNE